MTAAEAEVDPRVERSRRVILEATLAELGRVGYGPLTIEGVAARAGVGKSTIYRHWPGKLELVEDAFSSLRSAVADTGEGSFRDRVVAMLTGVAAHVADSRFSECLPAMIDAAERDEHVKALQQRITTERRGHLVALLDEGVAAGELPPGSDTDLLADALVGPIFLRRLLLHDPHDPAVATKLVDLLLPRP